MHLFFLDPAAKNLKGRSDEHMLVPIHEPPHNTSEGSEFLDDAIRMEDLAFAHTEESIGVGSPENLL